MDFDALTHKLGQFGRAQRVLYVMVCWMGLPLAFNNMGIVFLAGVPSHWCRTPELDHLNLSDAVLRNITIPESKGQFLSCARYRHNYSQWTTLEDIEENLNQAGNGSLEKCPHGWVYEQSVYTSTIVSQWDLVCDHMWLQAASSSIYMAGLAAGVIIIGSLSDMYGRRPSYVSSGVIALIGSVCLSFAPNFIAFCVIRFFIGFFTIAIFTTSFVIVMEIIGPDYRMHAGIGLEYVWAVSYMSYALFAYFIRDWYTLNLAASCAMLPALVTLFFVSESPRWLYLQGRNKEADIIVRQIAKRNKVELPDNLEVSVKVSKKGYLWDLVRTPRMAVRSTIMFYNWFVNSCVYYGLSLNTSNLGGNDFLNFLISGAVEIPAYMMCQLTLQYVGRRWPICVSMVCSGVALLCIMAIPADLNWVAVVLAMCGKFCISASFGMIYILTAEMYPTTVRNVAVGTGSFFARLGGVVAPYIALLGQIKMILPMLIFGIMSLSAGLLALVFPETKGKDLPETLEEGENFGRRMKRKDVKLSGEINPNYEIEDTLGM